MLEVMIAAPASGSGKTVLACALLAALKRRGNDPCAFKCGPDYIDPMFHRSVLGVESRNLDLFLTSEDAVRSMYGSCAASHGAAVTEGAMGFYDGLGGTTDQASAWHTADALNLPVLLAVRPRGSSLTLAAQLKGLLGFRNPSHIKALFLTGCSPMLAKTLQPMLEQETSLPVLGCLPHMEEAQLESRHLGLRTAGEIADLSDRIDRVSRQLEANMDWTRFSALYETQNSRKISPFPQPSQKIPLAIARDEAFCFLYEETLDVLRRAGADLRFFSPLRDKDLPEDACGLYLPGGYPELYAEALSANESMRRAVKTAVEKNLPTVAECGGFLYLGQTLQGGDGRIYPMAAVLPGEAVRKDRLVRFGYAELRPEADSLLFRSGEAVPIHEFHYWDSTGSGASLTAVKPLTGRSWRCAYAGDRLYAGFPHLYFAGRPALAERFIQAAKAYREEQTNHVL